MAALYVYIIWFDDPMNRACANCKLAWDSEAIIQPTMMKDICASVSKKELLREAAPIFVSTTPGCTKICRNGGEGLACVAASRVPAKRSIWYFEPSYAWSLFSSCQSLGSYRSGLASNDEVQSTRDASPATDWYLSRSCCSRRYCVFVVRQSDDMFKEDLSLPEHNGQIHYTETPNQVHWRSSGPRLVVYRLGRYCDEGMGEQLLDSCYPVIPTQGKNTSIKHHMRDVRVSEYDSCEPTLLNQAHIRTSTWYWQQKQTRSSGLQDPVVPPQFPNFAWITRRVVRPPLRASAILCPSWANELTSALLPLPFSCFDRQAQVWLHHAECSPSLHARPECAGLGGSVHTQAFVARRLGCLLMKVAGGSDDRRTVQHP